MQISSNPAFQIFTMQSVPVDEADTAAPTGLDADFAAVLDGDAPNDPGTPETDRPEEVAPASPPPVPMPGLAIIVAPHMRMDMLVAAEPVATAPVGSQPADAGPESSSLLAKGSALPEVAPPVRRSEISEPLGDAPDASPPSRVAELVAKASPLPVMVAGGRLWPDGAGAGEVAREEAGREVPNPALPLATAPSAKDRVGGEVPPVPDSYAVDDPARTATADRPAEKPLHAGPAAPPQVSAAMPPINSVAPLPSDRSAEAAVQLPPEWVLAPQTAASPVLVAAGKILVPGEGRPGADPAPRGAKDGFPTGEPVIDDTQVTPPGTREPVQPANPGDQVAAPTVTPAVPGQVVTAVMRPMPTDAKDQAQEFAREIAVNGNNLPPSADKDIVPAMPTAALVDRAPISVQFPPPGAGHAMATAGFAASGGEGYLGDLAVRADSAPMGDPALPVWTPREAALAPRDIGGQIARALPDKPGAVELTLTPEELGRIRFEIQQFGDLVRMVLSAERPETMEHLRRHLPEFLADLRQAGFSGSDISFGQWSRGAGDNTPAWSGAFQDQGRNRHGPNANSWSRGDGVAAGGPDPAPQSSRNLGLGPGQLAIRV
jgi:hypothetical protein